jgi:predicted phage tail component-like protein
MPTPLRYFTFAGRDSRDYITWINKIERNYMPGVTVPSFKIPNRAGAVSIKRNEIEPGKIKITFTIGGVSNEEIRSKARDLATFLFYSSDQELIFSDEPDKKYFARFDQTGTDFEEIAYTGEGEILFTCFDPLAYSTEEKNETMGASNEMTVTNGGTYRIYPRLRVTPTAESAYIKITNTTTGKFLLYNETWPAAEPLVFDTDKNTVYNETTNENFIKNLALESEFFPLEIGPNTLRIENQNPDGTGVNGTLRVYWRERYL